MLHTLGPLEAKHHYLLCKKKKQPVSSTPSVLYHLLSGWIVFLCYSATCSPQRALYVDWKGKMSHYQNRCYELN